MNGDNNTRKKPNNIILEDRKKLNITGVTDVDGFDEQSIVMKTERGALRVRGRGLCIDSFSVESGEISIEGEIDALIYFEESDRKDNLFSRLFK